VDGTLNKTGYMNEVINLIVQYGEHSERATFHVTGISQTTIILGHTWLVEHNPEIDWCTGKVSLTRCPVSCRPKAMTDLTDQLIICLALPKTSCARRCTSNRSQKINKKPERLSHHQALHILTWMIWTKGIDSSYASWVDIGKKSK